MLRRGQCLLYRCGNPAGASSQRKAAPTKSVPSVRCLELRRLQPIKAAAARPDTGFQPQTTRQHTLEEERRTCKLGPMKRVIFLGQA